MYGNISDIRGLSDALNALQQAINTSPGGGGAVAGNFLIQIGHQLCDTAGTLIEFDTPYIDDQYWFHSDGMKNMQMVLTPWGSAEDGTKQLTGIYVYPQEDATTVSWIAVGRVAA